VILVDTSVWVEHFRIGNSRLAQMLEATEVLCHPFVIGELACGNLRARRDILELLANLPALQAVSHEEALHFLETRALHGQGLGWVDIHLLASAALASASVWSLDRRLANAAARVLS